jgi:hypothetical protein
VPAWRKPSTTSLDRSSAGRRVPIPGIRRPSALPTKHYSRHAKDWGLSNRTKNRCILVQRPSRLIRQNVCPNYIKFRMTLNRIQNRDLSWHTRELRHGRRRTAKTGRLSSAHESKANRQERRQTIAEARTKKTAEDVAERLNAEDRPPRRRPLVGITFPTDSAVGITSPLFLM